MRRGEEEGRGGGGGEEEGRGGGEEGSRGVHSTELESMMGWA